VTMLINGESNGMLELLHAIIANMPDCQDGDIIHALVARDGTVLASWGDVSGTFDVETPDSVILDILTQQYSVVLDGLSDPFDFFEFDIAEVKLRYSLNMAGTVLTVTPWRRTIIKCRPGQNQFVFAPTAKSSQLTTYLKPLAKACLVFGMLVMSPLIAFSRYSPPVTPAVQPEPIVVYVKGYVVKPGVYKIRGDAKVADAVNAAGGLGFGADPAKVDFSQPLSDCQEVIVPGKKVISDDKENHITNSER